MINMLSGLIAYCLKENKLSLQITAAEIEELKNDGHQIA